MGRFSVLVAFAFALVAMACATTASTTTDSAPEAVKADHSEAQHAEAVQGPGPAGNFAFSEIAFMPFNPEKPEGIHVYPIKGDPSKGAFSALVKLPPGFAVPEHTHTHAYSGVTLNEGFAAGKAAADAKVLPKFSVFVQPAGNSHYNECKSETHCYFMVNFKGAVDMKPVEAPLAGDGDKVITLGTEIPWKAVREDMPDGPKMFAFHGNPKEGAFDALVWFPAGMSTNIHTHSSGFAALVLQGEHHRGASMDAAKALGPGSVWHEAADTAHFEKCAGPENCIFAISFDGALDTSKVEMNK